MPAHADLVITGLGAVSPVGLSAPATCASLRAGIARLAEIESFAVDGELFDRKPVVGGRVPLEWFRGGPVETEWPGHERFGAAPPPAEHRLVPPGPGRLAELAVPAAVEAMRAAGLAEAGPAEVGLYLGVDEADSAEELAGRLAPQINVGATAPTLRAAGRAAALVALERAADDLSKGRIAAALVGGADSLLRGEVLSRLQGAGRLKSRALPHGVIPGEAAAFVVVERGDAARRRGAAPLALLTAATVSAEPTAGTDEPNQAAGLTRALREARRVAGGFDAPPLVVCDLNGDRYRGIEWSLARLRALGDLHGDADLWHPADCIGDCGAASGALNLVYAATALRKGYARSSQVLVWGASDGRWRGAAVLAAEADA